MDNHLKEVLIKIKSVHIIRFESGTDKVIIRFEGNSNIICFPDEDASFIAEVTKGHGEKWLKDNFGIEEDQITIVEQLSKTSKRKG